jgi:hypothetical protein
MASSTDHAYDVDEVDGYVEGRGPGIPELPAGDQAVAGAAALEGDALLALPGWEQEAVEQFLSGTGHGLHFLLGAGEKDWLMTRADLDRIAPPLTRILNRYEPTMRASVYADPLLVAHGTGLYAWRSVLQRQAALRAHVEQRRDGYVHVDDLADEPAASPQAAAAQHVDGAAELLDEEEPYIPYAQRRHES